MTSTHWKRAKEIFDDAVELVPASRPEFVARICGGDARLEREVLELLAAHERLDPVMPTGGAAEVVARLDEEQPGRRFGRYRLREKIGEGGFGVVWMAEQEEPIRRSVAIKVLKVGLDTRQVIARFEAERQALAMMDHPGIARVLDAGSTETGRPYFVMELVRGLPITEFCDQAKLSTDERLELFTQVCSAVQHAHQKGVIHRDLKPSNVLVTLHDGTPVPKVIDFGIAKALGEPLTDKTLFTEFRQVLGTPDYMAPEQAGYSELDVDTRADIYALGVLLYELLTGTKPFEMKSLMREGYEAVLRTLREVDPPRPSTRVSTPGGAQRAIAALRQTEPQALWRRIKGDLDWIVMKALEKDRSRRYESAAAFAADVRAALRDEPVSATPPGMRRRALRFARRNRVAVAAASAVLLSLIFGLVLALNSYMREREARERAERSEREEARLHAEADAEREAAERERGEAQRAQQAAQQSELRAQRELKRSRLVVGFLTDMLRSVEGSIAMGRDTELLREVLDRAAERVGAELAGEPEVEADLSAEIGEVYRQLGEYRRSEALHLRALELRTQALGPDDFITGISQNDVGLALYQQGRLEPAERHLREALRVQLAARGESDDSVLAVRSNLAAVLLQLGQIEAADREFGELVKVMRPREGAAPSPAAALAIANQASVKFHLKHFPEMIALTREALAIFEQCGQGDSPDGLRARMNLAVALRANGELAESIAVSRANLVSLVRILGAEHPEVATAQNNLGSALYSMGDKAAAELEFQRCIEARRRIFGDASGELCRPLSWLARCALDAGDKARAIELLSESVRVADTAYGPRHREAIVAGAFLAEALQSAGRVEDARAQFESCWERAQDLAVRDVERASLRGNWSALLGQLGEVERALALLDGEYRAHSAAGLAADSPELEDLRGDARRVLEKAPKDAAAVPDDVRRLWAERGL